MRTAEIDHRLDREEHPFAQHLPFAGTAEMEDAGRVVEHAPDPVAAEVAHHRAALRLRIALDGVADIAERRAHAIESANEDARGEAAALLEPVYAARQDWRQLLRIPALAAFGRPAQQC